MNRALTTVGNFPDLATAALAQSVLADHGISSLIPDEYLAGIDWQLITALQGIRLQVASADSELARWHLSQFSPEHELSAEEDAAAGQAPETCPRCQSTLLGPPRWKRRLKAATFLIPPLLFLYPILALASSKYTCFSCGHGWNHDD